MIVMPPHAADLAARVLREVECNHLFARSVLEGAVDGEVWVDALPEPQAFYVRHPYGMSLAYGELEAFARWEAFWKTLKGPSSRSGKDEWLQAWPQSLADAIDAFCILAPPGRIERHVRVNFQFDRVQFETLANAEGNPAGGSDADLVRTGAAEFDGLGGSVLPRYFWRDREHFLREGVGFSLIREGKVAATAFSAFIHDDQLEIGIETAPEFRGQGCAARVCRGLIAYCLERGLEPVWSCRLSNVGSMKLAHKLGFRRTRELPFFRLPGNI